MMGIKWVQRGIGAIAMVFVLFAIPQTVQAQEYVEELLQELSLEDVDVAVEEEGMPDKLSFHDLVMELAESKLQDVDFKKICEYVFDCFFYEIAAVRPVFFEITVISLMFALFGRLLVTKQGYVSEMAFFMIYIAIVLLLLQSFSMIGALVKDGVDKMVSFMTAFIPTYATTLLLSGNAASASFFYEVAFGIIYVMELVMKVLLIPGVHIYVLLVMMDHLFEEAHFLKLAELIGSGVRGILKLGLAAVVGLGVVQSLLAPAKDRLANSGIYQGLRSIPGVGNTFGAATELLLGCAMMIKNSVGLAALIILLILCVSPVVSVFCFYVMYRMVAALLEPFCDRRIVECISGVGQGSRMYLKMVIDIMLYFLITISVISASTSAIF